MVEWQVDPLAYNANNSASSQNTRTTAANQYKYFFIEVKTKFWVKIRLVWVNIRLIFSFIMGISDFQVLRLPVSIWLLVTTGQRFRYKQVDGSAGV